MKNLLLASAAMLALGAGTAFAQTTQARPAPTSAAPQATQAAPANGNGVYVTNAPRHEVWVYPAFRVPGYSQGGNQ
jgi:hypothetical protein